MLSGATPGPHDLRLIAHDRRTPRRSRHRLISALLTTALALAAATTTAASATADTSNLLTLDSATFEWGLSNLEQAAAEFGGCDYFSAGLSDGTTATYQTQSGDVHIIKRAADGTATAVSQADRCAAGDPDTGQGIGQRLLFSDGTGTTNTTTGETTIQWTGDVTINAYGGLVPWSITDPKLTVDADGVGRLSATMTGWASSIDDPSSKTALDPETDVTLADFTDVEVTESGITATPVFEGVDYYPITNGVRSATSAISDAVKTQRPDWGSWPESFVDFQYRTGLSSYWHSSGLTADPKKAPLPVSITFDDSVPQMEPVVVCGPSDVTVSEGGSATVQVTTAGYPAPTIQWEEKSTNATDWTAISGATSPSLTLESVTASDQGKHVRAVVTNSAGSATSDAATVTVEATETITILTQPQSIQVEAAGSAYLSVEVAGSSPQYQWQRSTDGGMTWTDWGSGAAKSSRLPTTTADDGNQYRVIVSNGISDPVTSEVATVTVIATAVTVTRSPVDALGFVDGKVIFRAYADGAPSPSWQWERSTDNGATWTVWSTDASSVIYVENLTADMDGDLFRAVASNGAGPDVTTEPRRLTVIPQTVRTVLYSPSATITAGEETYLALSGAGFSIPDSYTSSIRVGVMKASDWDPAAPDQTKFIGDYATVYASTLKRDQGAFARTLKIAADALQADENYLLVTFSAAAGDTSLNNAVPLVLSGDDRTVQPTPELLDDPSTGSLPASDLGLTTTTVGGELTVSGLEPNSWFHLTAYSTATAIGWYLTDAAGALTVSLPSTLAAGQHTLAVQNPAGIFRAWAGFEVSATTTPPTTQDSADSGGSSDTTSTQQDPGSSTRTSTGQRLSTTGLEAAPWATAAAALVLLGAVMVWLRKHRASR